ncbi:MAG: type VI secretion system lipoprotein TssJ, partial [Gammaproteobacteria bacterium]|nr:type VI secretion system lipoprotein TssJ [Gammaproteobacteria bacterium]
MSRPGTSRLPYGRTGPGRHRLRFAAFGLVAALLVSGCAKPPPPPPPPVVTKVELTLVAGPDANPDARGRASPLTVRVYALKSGNAFSSADFFSLFDKDQATLGAEIAQREEMLLRPGDTKT